MTRFALLGSLALIALLGCSEDTTEDTVANGVAEGATGAAIQQSVEMYEVYDGIFKPVDGPPTATLAHFERIQPNMTYDQVIKIVGTEPDIIKDQEMMPTLYLRREAKWINGDGTELTAVFANMRLQQKFQNGLE